MTACRRLYNVNSRVIHFNSKHLGFKRNQKGLVFWQNYRYFFEFPISFCKTEFIHVKRLLTFVFSTSKLYRTSISDGEH